MDLPEPTERATALAQPTRAHLFALLSERKRRVRLEELAEALDLHPNAVRQQLEHLREAGLVERVSVPSGRGRPHYEWSVAPAAEPGDLSPTSYGDLAAWLSPLTGSGAAAARRAEHAGRQIGRELAPREPQAPGPETVQTALAALGFAPHFEQGPEGSVTYRLDNCPYRKAVEQNPQVVCALHRGVTEGLLEEIAPGATLTEFLPKDPCAAGCVLEIEGLGCNC